MTAAPKITRVKGKKRVLRDGKIYFDSRLWIPAITRRTPMRATIIMPAPCL